ncbi:hypothetical protein J6590_057660, partial [Homalodisca vitripennis]
SLKRIGIGHFGLVRRRTMRTLIAATCAHLVLGQLSPLVWRTALCYYNARKVWLIELWCRSGLRD